MKLPFWEGHQGQTYTQEGADGIHKDNDLLKNASLTSESDLGYLALLPHKKLCFFISLTNRCCISVFDTQYSLLLFVYFDNYFSFLFHSWFSLF